MYPKIQSLHLVNFKSFGGDSLVGPFDDFTVLAGSNGLGKLHLIEAIEFVLSTDRSYASSSSEQLPDEPKPFVQITIRVSATTTVSLKRIVVPVDDSLLAVNDEDEEFWINERIVAKSLYQKRLHELHIRNGIPICYDRNTLPNIYLQSADACTEMFERVCDSFEFRTECDRLKKHVEAAKHNCDRINMQMWALHKRQLLMKRKYRNYKVKQEELKQIIAENSLYNLSICHKKAERSKTALQQMSEELLTNQTTISKLQKEIRLKVNSANEFEPEIENVSESQEELTELTKRLDSLLKMKQKSQDIYDYVNEQIHTLNSGIQVSTGDATVFLKSFLSNPQNVAENRIRCIENNITAQRRYNAHSSNALAHRLNQELISQSDHRTINDQLTHRIEQISDEQQKSAKLTTDTQSLLRKRFLEHRNRLRSHLIGKDGNIFPQQTIVATNEGLDNILEVVRNKMVHTVIFDTKEEAFRFQKRARSLETHVQIQIRGSANVPHSSNSSGQQLNDVVKLDESSNETLSALFKHSLPAMTVTESQERARSIVDDSTEDVTAICTDGTMFEACGRITFGNTNKNRQSVVARECESLRKHCDKPITPITVAGNWPMFPVDENLLQRQAPPKPTLDQLDINGSSTIETVSRYAQLMNALRYTLAENYAEQFNDARLSALGSQRNQIQQTINEANISIQKLKEQIVVQNHAHDKVVLHTQIEQLNGELVQFTEQVTNIEERIRNEADRLAESKFELHRLLIDAKKLESTVPLLQGNLDCLTEDVHSIDDIIIDFGSVDMNADEANVTAIINLNVEKSNWIRQTLKSLEGYKKAPNCFEKISAEHRRLNDEHDEADAVFERIAHEFREICKQRDTSFMPFFRHMNTYLQASYVELLASENARAALISPDDTSDHPWLKGILLEMIVPGRPYRKKNQLSTDEVVMASIATLFTMRSFGKTIPFVVLYEIDDVIVSERMHKLLVEFLVKRSMDRQVIMVSNSEQVYAKADSLIGVLVVDNFQSTTATLPSVDRISSD